MLVQHIVSSLRAKIESLRAATFVRSVGVLVGGTACAQVLTVLALPLITRLYTPTDFSLLAAYVSIVTVIAVVACLRLEIAISIPEHEADAANLLALALCSCSVIAALTGISVWLCSPQVIELIGLSSLRQHLWLLPLGIWLTSAYSAVQYWFTRKKKFSIVSRTRMAQTAGGIGAQLGLGWMGIGPLGLLLGYAISSGAGLLGLSRNGIRGNFQALRIISWPGMRRILRQYSQYPKYSTWEAFANSAGTQLPILLIATLAIGPEAGYLMLATRAIAAPMGMIGTAVSQVFLSQAPVELRAGRLDAFILRVIGGLARTGVGILIFIGIVAPGLVPLVFGHEWQRAGELIAWMTPWFVMQFLVSPVSMSLHVTGKLRVALTLQITGLCLRLGGTIVAVIWLGLSYIAEAYAVTGFLFYSLYLYVVILHVGVGARDFCRHFVPGLRAIAIWALTGAMFVICTH